MCACSPRGCGIETCHRSQEFAKVWTGFAINPVRENLQIEGHAAGNRVADNDTISDDFKELDRGRWFSLVNEDGAMERWRLRG